MNTYGVGSGCPQWGGFSPVSTGTGTWSPGYVSGPTCQCGYLPTGMGTTGSYWGHGFSPWTQQGFGMPYSGFSPYWHGSWGPSYTSGFGGSGAGYWPMMTSGSWPWGPGYGFGGFQGGYTPHWASYWGQGYGPGFMGYGHGFSPSFMGSGYTPGYMGYGFTPGFGQGFSGWGYGQGFPAWGAGFSGQGQQGFPGWGAGFMGGGTGFGHPSFTGGGGMGFGYPGFTAGGMVSDDQIREMIYDTIDADPSVPYDADLNVEVQGGVVTLTGTVPSKRMKHAVGDDAWWVPGVWDVNNNIQVTGRRQARGGGFEGGSRSTTGRTTSTRSSQTRGQGTTETTP